MNNGGEKLQSLMLENGWSYDDVFQYLCEFHSMTSNNSAKLNHIKSNSAIIPTGESNKSHEEQSKLHFSNEDSVLDDKSLTPKHNNEIKKNESMNDNFLPSEISPVNEVLSTWKLENNDSVEKHSLDATELRASTNDKCTPNKLTEENQNDPNKTDLCDTKTDDVIQNEGGDNASCIVEVDIEEPLLNDKTPGNDTAISEPTKNTESEMINNDNTKHSTGFDKQVQHFLIDTLRKGNKFAVKRLKQKYNFIQRKNWQSYNHQTSEESSINYDKLNMEIDENLHSQLKEQLALLRARKPKSPLVQIKQFHKGEYKKKLNRKLKNWGESLSLDITPTHFRSNTCSSELQKTLLTEIDRMPISSNEISKTITDVPTISITEQVTNEKALAEKSSNNSKTNSQLVEANLTTPNQKCSESNSAFISNTLDDYLTNDSELLISYDVPQLAAEGIGFSSNEISLTTPVASKKPTKSNTVHKYIDILYPEQQKKRDVCKPKTLAEKRKMLNNKRIIKLSASERRNCEIMRLKLLEGNTPFTRRSYKASINSSEVHSYVIHNNKKLKVITGIKPSVVAKITVKSPVQKLSVSPVLNLEEKNNKNNADQNTKRPSLLDSLKPATLKLQKKKVFGLQTIVKKLPKVSVNIVPELRKSVHPKLQHFIKLNSTCLTKTDVEFALSTLKVDNAVPKPRVFTFPVDFANKRTSVNFKKFVKLDVNKLKIINPRYTETDPHIKEVVNCVVNDMLDYVERAEAEYPLLTDNYIPESEDSSAAENIKAVCRLNTPRRQRNPLKRPRVDLELRRINCPLISLAYDKDDSADISCKKKTCQLGCICKSINCYSGHLLSGHCGKVECMFMCTCGYNENYKEKTILLQQGSNIGSGSLLRRIEDEAKKDLAKVEKDYAQTVIKTDNRLILLGESTKRRRETKMPKRYMDFLDVREYDIDGIHSTPPKSNEESQCPITSDNNSKIKPCFVELQKVDFSPIIPYCIVHNLYKCHCNYEEIVDSGKKNILNYTAYFPTNKTGNVLEEDSISSARTLSIPPKYSIERNKSELHKREIQTESEALNLELIKYLFENAKEIRGDTDSQPPTIEVSPKKQPVGLKHGNTKNPSTEVEQKKQPKKRKSTPFDTKFFINDTYQMKDDILQALRENSNGDERSQYRVMAWEVFVQRYSQKLIQVWYTTNRFIPQLVLTDYRKPARCYNSVRDLKITDKSIIVQNLIVRCLLEGKVPGERPADSFSIIIAFNNSFWEICGVCEKKDTVVERQIETIQDNQINQTLQNADFSHDNGITDAQIDHPTSVQCDSPQEGVATASSANDIDDSSLDIMSTSKDNPISSPQDNSISTPQDNPIYEAQTNATLASKPVITTNIPNDAKSLQKIRELEDKQLIFSTKRQFQPKKLVSDLNTKDNDMRQVLWASIPNVAILCKWRIVYLNTKFDYLCFSQSHYSIKYDDILKALKLAQSERTTVVLRSTEVRVVHRDFGIYCVHNYSDKILVGPYFVNETDNLEAINIENGVIVHTDLLKDTPKKSNAASWFYQNGSFNQNTSDDDVIIIDKPPATIDLTCESDDETFLKVKESKRVNSTSTSKTSTSVLKRLLVKRRAVVNIPENDVVVYENALVENASDKPTHSITIDKYIICDTVNIGYISATQDPSSNIIDITCPLTETVKSFADEKTALNSVARTLERLLILVPPVTRLKLRMISRFENDSTRIDKQILDGYHIVGNFGIKNLRKTTPAELKQLQIPDSDITRVFIKYQEALLRRQFRILAQLLNISLKDPKQTLHNILNSTLQEVTILPRISEELNAEKEKLKTKNFKLIQKCKELLNALPERDQNAFKQIFGVTGGASQLVNVAPSSSSLVTVTPLTAINRLFISKPRALVRVKKVGNKSIQLLRKPNNTVVLSGTGSISGNSFTSINNRIASQKVSFKPMVSSINTGQTNATVLFKRDQTSVPSKSLPATITRSSLLTTNSPSSSVPSTSRGVLKSDSNYSLAPSKPTILIQNTENVPVGTLTPISPSKILANRPSTSGISTINAVDMKTTSTSKTIVKLMTASGVPLTGVNIGTVSKKTHLVTSKSSPVTNVSNLILTKESGNVQTSSLNTTGVKRTASSTLMKQLVKVHKIVPINTSLNKVSNDTKNE